MGKTDAKSLDDAHASSLSPPKATYPPISQHLSWADLPDWRRDNNYIQSGYPVLADSWAKAWFLFLGRPHNETVNILTHLFGAVVASACFIYSYRHIALPNYFGKHPLQETLQQGICLIYPFRHEGSSITTGDAWAFASFFVAALLCFGFSTAFHTSLCYSEHTSRFLNKLDYVGIVFMITGTQFPLLYYAFYCNPISQLVYMAGVAVFGAMATFFVLSPEYSGPKYISTRTWIFNCLGNWGFLPVLHCLAQDGWDHLQRAFALKWLLLGGAIYIGGGILYAGRLPERFWPGRFDIYGNSHQLLHICCLFAALSHYIALCLQYNFRHYDPAGSCSL